MFVSSILARIGQMLSARRMRRELSTLSDRELDDIGITRSQIGAAILSGGR